MGEIPEIKDTQFAFFFFNPLHHSKPWQIQGSFVSQLFGQPNTAECSVSACQDSDTAAGDLVPYQDVWFSGQAPSFRLQGWAPTGTPESQLSQALSPAWAQECCCPVWRVVFSLLSRADALYFPFFSGEDDVRNLQGLQRTQIPSILLEITGWELQNSV